MEYFSISRDTTESDLKQRREISVVRGEGATVRYVNQPVVQAALHGRLLVLEGLEKAERNLLPLINNLLENREMALEDGGFMMAPERYDSLLQGGVDREELSSRGLLRVSPDFLVIALGLPVPRFPGNSLDPPLRSRFQARAIPPPPSALRKRHLAALSPPSAASLSSAVDAIDALDALHALRASPSLSSDFTMPCVPADALVSVGKLQAAFPHAETSELLHRLLPHASETGELADLLHRFELGRVGKGETRGGRGGEGDSTACGYQLTGIRTASVEEVGVASAEFACLSKKGRLGVATWTGERDVETLLPLGPAPLQATVDLQASGLVSIARQQAICSALLQDHAVAMDACLLGSKGCAKTSIVKRFGGLLGHAIPQPLL